MEVTQEEYEQAPVLATVTLLGTKRSQILDEGERETMTFNKYDIANVGLTETSQHFRWIDRAATEKGDALISYVVEHNGSDIVKRIVENLPAGRGPDWFVEVLCDGINSFRNLDQSQIMEIVRSIVETDPSEIEREALQKSSVSGIKQLLIGNFFSFHQADSLDFFNDDPFLQQQIQDVLRNEGNANGFPVYFAEYEDKTFALVFSYLDEQGDATFIGSLRYKMRQKESMNDSFVYNDAHPDNDAIYTSSLSLTENMIDDRGALMIYKQWVGDADAIRLVGFMKGVIVEEAVVGSPEHGLLSNFFRDGCLIEEEHSA